jgi:hypothetical protein
MGGEEESFKSIGVSADGASQPPPSGHTNEISTTKYTLLSWLPLSFVYQFRRVGKCQPVLYATAMRDELLFCFELKSVHMANLFAMILHRFLCPLHFNACID